MKFADVKNDIAFRKVFGNESRTESLISFLNAVLGFEGEERIQSVTILDPYQLPKLRGGKVSILDVRAIDQRGQQFIVEMQVAEKDGFDKRVLYYLTKSYTNQIARADQYRELRPAYFIGILGDFVHTQNPHYISRSRIQDIDTGEVTIKDVEFTFIELVKFSKTAEQLETLVDKWVFFIKNAENLHVVPPNVDDKGLLSAYEEANQHTWSRGELDAYDYVYMREEDGRAELDAAVAKAVANAEKRSREEERAKAEAEKAELRAKAEAEKIQTMLTLAGLGLSVESIAAAINKPADEVAAILAKHKEA